MRKALVFIFGLVLSFLAQEAQAANPDPIKDPESLSEMPTPDTPYFKFLKSHLLKCAGEGQMLSKPVEMDISGRKFVFDGRSMNLQSKDPDGLVTIGTLGAIKDFSKETQAALDFFLDKFKKENVDVIVLDGDIAATEFEITQVVLYCARSGLPVLALIGNTEGRTAFNRALFNAAKVAMNAINFDLVRRVDLGGAVLVSLPGYLDKKFVHQSGGCSYSPKEVRGLSEYIKDAKAPVVVVSHGPPAGKDKNALDTAVEAGNVGDARLAGFLLEHKIPFGIFCHILEAGGRALDMNGNKVKTKEWVKNVYMNVGSANPLPWQLNSGKLSCGMASILKIKDGKGMLEFIEHPCK